MMEQIPHWKRRAGHRPLHTDPGAGLPTACAHGCLRTPRQMASPPLHQPPQMEVGWETASGRTHWSKTINVCFVLIGLRRGLGCGEPETVSEATRRGHPRAWAKSHPNSEPSDKKQTILPVQLKTCHRSPLRSKRREQVPQGFTRTRGRALPP